MVVGDLIRRTAARFPEREGVVFEEKRFTWKEVNSRINSLSNALLAFGLKKQDRVAILCGNCNQYLEFYMASAKAGMIGVPLNARFLGKELTYLLNDSGANTLFVDEEYLETVKGMSSELKDVKNYIGIGDNHPFDYDFEELIQQYPDHEPEVVVEEEDIYVLAYTSGTTGRPKGAIITHKNGVAAGNIYVIEMRLTPFDRFMAVGPFYFGAAAGQRFPSLLRGCTLVITSFEPSGLFRVIDKEKITVFFSNPVAINMLINHPDRDKYDLSSIRYIGLTAAPLPVEILREAKKLFGDVFFPNYGMTETGPTGTILQTEDYADEGALSKRMGSIGKAVVNMDVKVVNEDGEEIARDGKAVGEILLKGDNVSSGYWNDPEKTKESIKDGWLYTGDIATVDEDGYIYIVDRKKDMIISGGINIYPREIEEILYTHPSVMHATVIGVPDEKWGETPKVVIVLKKGAKATEEEIIELCKANLASYKKPSSVEFVDSLPMTPTGKILKREIRKKYWEGREKQV